jgi:PAS domain S-box-containing protein
MALQRSGEKEELQHSEERFRLLVESVRDYAIFMLDPDGRVLTWNAGAQRFKGYRADEIIGQHFSRFYPSEALARGLPEYELEEARKTGVFEDEGWRVRKDGSLFWANVVITVMRNPQGELIGFAKVTRDLTQQRGHEQDLHRSEERFRLLVEGVAEYAIFMLDPNGHVVTWNVGAERIKGYTSAEIIGKGQLYRYRVACAQGRHDVLGQCHDHGPPRRHR